ncbi:dihydrofolate reductase family protein [Baekduia sp. Peel2402]|uniref:dihydrofolate reductase family protein n=1 Tax=Baekduia sp. Peel2402 TaxID=3458296 RepID=UPI00403E750C
MSDLIITTFASLDGVMQAPGGEPGYAHAGWVGPHFSDALGAYKGEEQEAADVLLLGRVTYESFYGAWPEREGAMADKINTMKKVVVSTTLGSSPWDNTTVIADDVAARVADLKANADGPILVAGSQTLAHFLMAEGLVDQLNLQVFPVILGSGIRIFPETTDPLPLTLASSRTLENGVLLQSYRFDA